MTVSVVLEILEKYTTSITSSLGKVVKDAVEEATRNLVTQETNQSSVSQVVASSVGGIQIGLFR